jgi:hypothetical protein
MRIGNSRTDKKISQGKMDEKRRVRRPRLWRVNDVEEDLNEWVWIYGERKLRIDKVVHLF